MSDDGQAEVGDPIPADDGAPAECAVCGTPLDRGAWHPTVGYTGPDGTYDIVRFCSDGCRDDWQADRERPDAA